MTPTICVDLAARIATRKLPVRTYEQVVREAIKGAAGAPVNGNGSPVIQPGYNRGVRPLSYGRTYPAEILTAVEVFALLDALPKTGPVGVRNACVFTRAVGEWGHTKSAPAPIGVGRGHGTEGIGFDAV